MTLSLNRQVWAKRAAWTWASFLLIACLIPAVEVPKVDVPLADKWVHFVLFGGQTFLALAALRNPSRKNIFLTIALCALGGVLVEVLQLMTHAWFHRAFEVMDMVADAVGVVIGWILFGLLQKYFPETARLPE